ncbi:MAG: hypothetical protein Q4A75_09905 [Peptostreptococcaceae bacterium]|nr:hypothetical protein [Peptostreptococcaceae bacterium]
MSKINYVEIMFHERKTCFDFVELLLENDWQFEREGNMTICLGVEDDHEWIDMPADREKLADYIESWKDAKYRNGFKIYYQGTELGGTLFIEGDASVSFIVSADAIYNKNLEGMKIIQVDWYLEKLLGPIKGTNIQLLHLKVGQF